MVTTRLADKAADYPAIIAGAYAFAAESGLNEFLPETGDPFEQAVARIIAAPTTEVLLAEHDGAVVGGIGLAYGPYLWNPSLTAVDELFFWVAPSAPQTTALSLLRAAQSHLRSQPLDLVTFASLPSSPAKLGTVYERIGLKPFQTSYVGRP